MYEEMRFFLRYRSTSGTSNSSRYFASCIPFMYVLWVISIGFHSMLVVAAGCDSTCKEATVDHRDLRSTRLLMEGLGIESCIHNPCMKGRCDYLEIECYCEECVHFISRIKATNISSYAADSNSMMRPMVIDEPLHFSRLRSLEIEGASATGWFPRLIAPKLEHLGLKNNPGLMINAETFRLSSSVSRLLIADVEESPKNFQGRTLSSSMSCGLEPVIEGTQAISLDGVDSNIGPMTDGITFRGIFPRFRVWMFSASPSPVLMVDFEWRSGVDLSSELSIRIYASSLDSNSTVLQLAEGTTTLVTSEGINATYFCTWKRDGKMDIGCGLAATKEDSSPSIVVVRVHEDLTQDEQLQQAVFNLTHFVVQRGNDQLTAPQSNQQTNVASCTARDPWSNQRVDCDEGVHINWTYRATNFVQKNLRGCALLDEFPPAQSNPFKSRGLRWCPTRLSSESVYIKTQSGKPNLNWALCECNPASPSLVEYCVGSYNAILLMGSSSSSPPSFKCNPFNCTNGSVRCADDSFSGTTCGESRSMKRCETKRTARVACPIHEYFTCGDGECIHVTQGASGCDSHQGVRFSPQFCGAVDVADASPGNETVASPPTLSATPAEDPHESSLVAAGGIDPSIPWGISFVILFVLCVIVLCVVWRRSRKESQEEKDAHPRSLLASKTRFPFRSKNVAQNLPNEKESNSPSSLPDSSASVPSSVHPASTTPTPKTNPMVEDPPLPNPTVMSPSILGSVSPLPMIKPPLSVTSSRSFGDGSTAFSNSLKHYSSSATVGSRPSHHHHMLVSPTPTMWSQDYDSPRFEPLPGSALLGTLGTSQRSLRRSHDSSAMFSPTSMGIVRSISFRSTTSTHAGQQTNRRGDDDDLETRSTVTTSSSGYGNNLSINFEDIELGEMLGCGGNGRIFCASYNGTPVAVKELYSVMRGRSSEFVREFEALRLLRHPHIIQLFGTCVAPSMDAQGLSRYFIVTELAVESLADRLARLEDPIDLATAERYAAEIASAGAFIHSQQMIHFDFKPQNVLLDVSGTVKICDLGIAKFARNNTVGDSPMDLTNNNGGGGGTGSILTTMTSGQGTPAYMSPELLAGDDPSKITYKVDVYAFGIMVWEIIHRTPPYPPSWSLLTLFRNVDAGYRPPIDDRKLPRDESVATSTMITLRRIIETCWDVELNRRPQFKDIIGWLRQQRKRSQTAGSESHLTPILTPQRKMSIASVASVSTPTGPSYSKVVSLPPTPAALEPERTTPDVSTPRVEEQSAVVPPPATLLAGVNPGAKVKIRYPTTTTVDTSSSGQLNETELKDGEVMSIGSDGKIELKVSSGDDNNQHEEDQSSTTMVVVTPDQIVRVMQPEEEDEDVFFFPADRTIRGLALAHARRKVQEFKRALERDRAMNQNMGPLTPLALPVEVTRDDLKLIVVKDAAADHRVQEPVTETDDTSTAATEARPSGDLLAPPSLKLDLSMGAPPPQNGKSLKAAVADDSDDDGEDEEEMDEMTRELFISEGVKVDAAGGLWKRAKNRKLFKAPPETSAQGSSAALHEAVLAQVAATSSSLTSVSRSSSDDSFDPLTQFQSISEQSIVILSEIGSGACGMVYKAIHISTLQLVAVKRVNVSDRLKRHQVVRETRIMLANNIQLQTPRPPNTPSATGTSSLLLGGRTSRAHSVNAAVQSFRINPDSTSAAASVKVPSLPPLQDEETSSRPVLDKSVLSFSQKLLTSAKKMLSNHESSSSALFGARQHRRPRFGSVTGATMNEDTHHSSSQRRSLGRRFSSSDSPAHAIKPTRSEGRLSSLSKALSTKSVAREITQVKASSFACDKIVKLYDAALFSREAFSGSSSGASLRLNRPSALSGDTDLALIMEFLDGGSLEDHMKHSGPCTDETTLSQVALDCLEALHFLQTNRIIHRDIKPANVMLGRRGTAKLTDFGVVKEVEEGASVMVKTFVGTISYMSPERLRGHAYSFVSDIWSFGMTLLAFALGRYPVSKEHSKNIFALLEFFEKHDIMESLAIHFSEDLVKFFRVCLDPDPTTRPSAVELLSHPFILGHAQSREVQKEHNASMDHTLWAIPREERLMDLQYITRKVVEKMFADWVRQQRDHEQFASSLGLKTPRSVEFSFSEDSFVRLSRQLGVSTEEVRKAFESQIMELRTILRL